MDLHWLVIISTLVLSAFFSGMEIAFVNSNKLLVELDKRKEKLSGKILSSFLKSPSGFISTLMIGNNIVLVIYGITAVRILEPYLQTQFPVLAKNTSFMLVMQTIIAALIILITAEFLPKLIFRIYTNRLLNFFALPFKILNFILYPLNLFFYGISRFILKRIFKLDFSKETTPLFASELEHSMKDYNSNKREDYNAEPEIQMLQNAIEFKNIKLRECMIPRTEIVDLEENESMEKLQKLYLQSGHSKIIIYRETIDNIIGYTHAYDMFSQPEQIKDILKPMLFVPGTMLANQLLSKFIKEHKSIAVVVDEFGGTAGILTLEDVIEEIFGEINDEFDVEEFIEKQVDEDEFIFSGRLEIDHLNEKYNFGLPEDEDYETLAGYIIQNHESIPKPGTEIRFNNFIFTILKASETRIDQVKMKRENKGE